MAKPKSKLKYPPAPDTSSADMNTFAADVWIAGRCGHWDRANPNAPIPDLPDWLSPASLARVGWLEAQGDPNGDVTFFRRLCDLSHASTPQGQLVMMAMMACMGWNEVVDDLVNLGAPVSLTLPLDRWEWTADGKQRSWGVGAKIEKAPGIYQMDALSLAVAASLPDTAAAPLHPGRQASLERLVAAGCDPNTMPATLVRVVVETGKLARLMVRLGLRAGTDAQGEPFLARLMSPDTTLAQNQRNLLLAQLIGCGMPAHPPGCNPLMAYISASVFGINALKVAMTHPDRGSIDGQALEYEKALRSRAASRRSTPTPEEVERVDLLEKLAGSAKMGVATAMVSGASTPRRRM